MNKRIALSLISLIASLGSAPVQAHCDGCDIYHHTSAHGKIPYDGPMVCLNYVQAGNDKVVVRFMKGGIKVHTASNQTGPRDRFCFGRWRFTRPDVKPDEIWFCNGTKSARLTTVDIEKVVLNRGTPPWVHVCLLGSKECKDQAIVVEGK